MEIRTTIINENKNTLVEFTTFDAAADYFEARRETKEEVVVEAPVEEVIEEVVEEVVEETPTEEV